MNETLPGTLLRILSEVPALRHAFLVGGCVRDWILEGPRPRIDYDVEVFGVGYDDLSRALAPWGRVDLVGRSFGVLKLTVEPGVVFDFSVPRRDSKVAPGHRGFEVRIDPSITPREAAQRRDFTLNALMWDPHRGELLDFFGGAEDLRQRILRHVGPAFVDDPLRVLRGVQLCGRFDLQAAPETVELCRSIRRTAGELAGDRVRDEWFKWARSSTRPSAGLRFLQATGWIDPYPEVAALVGTEQDRDWHPEGDVWVHTLHCLDALVRLPEWRNADPETRTVLSLAVLAHDFGKPSCSRTEERDGRLRWISPGHEPAGGPLAERFLASIHAPRAVVERVVPLVTSHLAHLQEVTPRAVRRLARRLEPATIRELVAVITADAGGRPPLPPEAPPSATALLEAAESLALEAAAPKPILMGRHLLERGLAAGPAFREVLDAAFEAQLDGQFGDLRGALAWLDRRLGATDAP